MPPKDPLDDFLDKVEELIQKVEKSNFTEGEIPKEILEQLGFLEHVVDNMVHANEATFKELKISESHIVGAIEKTQALESSEKKTMKRVDKLKKDAKDMQRKFSLGATMNKELKTHTKQGKVAARRKKFRRMGGKEGWTPL